MLVRLGDSWAIPSEVIGVCTYSDNTLSVILKNGVHVDCGKHADKKDAIAKIINDSSSSYGVGDETLG